MDTELISDLRNELALALIVEQRHAGEVQSREVPAFIRRVTDILSRSPNTGTLDTRSEAASAKTR